MDEAFLPEGEIAEERKNDWLEVNNYIRALNVAVEELKSLPVSSRLMRKTHQILMDGVRGEHKQPGNFRRSQNRIGGNTLTDAVFIPPHHEYISALMGDLEKFLHNDPIRTPALIRVAIAHYQFETIHPFLDGNGRIGRLLIPLFLVSEGILSKPLLYFSQFFEKNKSLYYDNLTRVRTHDDMTQWLRYFLSGMIETSAQGVDTLTQVIELKASLEKEIRLKTNRRTNNALAILQRLFMRPMITINEVAVLCECTFRPAADLVRDLEQMGVLQEYTGQLRSRIYRFEPYLKIFRDQV